MTGPSRAEVVRRAFRDQARACRALGSPFTADLCESFAGLLDPAQGAVARRLLDWPGDPSVGADSVPLRLCGALHALVLDGRDAALADAYAARRAEPDLLLAVLARHEGFVLDWLDSPPQTNEVGRSAALIAGARFLGGLRPLPMRVLELGASAGLNLNFHRYHLAPDSGPGVVLDPDWQGDRPEGRFRVDTARGVDLRPLDPAADGLRLMAYCWADQDARLARLRAALALARRHPPQVDAGDAGAWLGGQLRGPLPEGLVLVIHTVAAQYFPPATRQQAEATLQQTGARAGPGRALAHLAMEADGGEGAALTLRLWDGNFRGWHLGRADFHGRWLRWAPRAVEAGTGALAP